MFRRSTILTLLPIKIFSRKMNEQNTGELLLDYCCCCYLRRMLICVDCIYKCPPDHRIVVVIIMKWIDRNKFISLDLLFRWLRYSIKYLKVEFKKWICEWQKQTETIMLSIEHSIVFCIQISKLSIQTANKLRNENLFDKKLLFDRMIRV